MRRRDLGVPVSSLVADRGVATHCCGHLLQGIEAVPADEGVAVRQGGRHPADERAKPRADSRGFTHTIMNASRLSRAILAATNAGSSRPSRRTAPPRRPSRQGQMRVYTAARTVVDLMRFRHRIGEPLALGALRRYLTSTGARPGLLLDLALPLGVLGPVRADADVL